MKMPCTQHDDQEQLETQRVSFRSTFNVRNAAGLRYTSQQNLHSFAVPFPHQHQHPPIAIVPQSFAPPPLGNLSGTEDVTEQIRISVQDTHISHGASEEEFNGTIEPDEECLDESYLAFLDRQYDYVERNSSLIRHVGQNQPINQQSAPTASTSSSSSIPSSSTLSDSRIDSAIEVHEQSDPPLQIRTNIIGKDCNEYQNDFSDETSPSLRLLETCKSANSKCSERDSKQKKLCDFQAKKVSSPRPLLSSRHDLQHNPDEKLRVLDNLPPYMNRQVGVIKSHLFNGSSFKGQQNSRSESYDVNVKIQHVDYESSYLNGYLCIAHLTRTHPTLTTFFEGEIISEQYPFLTRKWEASKEIDRAHWSKFEGFNERYFEDSFNYNELKNSEYIYMRWKELFLVPDHTIKNVEGASYAGFYYVCYSKRTSQIKGYYFHIAEHFERFQSLNLELDQEERTSQVYEFR